MQAFGLSLIKGRLGSDQERRRDEPRPNERTRPAAKAGRPEPAEGRAFGAARMSRRECRGESVEARVSRIVERRRRGEGWRLSAARLAAVRNNAKGPSDVDRK